MFIKRVILDKYKAFDFSGIKKLDMDTTGSNVQLIIGDNGSGKSSLLRAITPVPPTRTDYKKNGSFSIEIHHDGHEYILSSDFSNKVSPHSFICDGEELNVGGTTGVQTGMIESHLGYSNEIHKLTHLESDITKMTRSQRKAFLFANTRADLNQFLDKHKKICSRIRGFKSTINTLTARKAESDTFAVSEEELGLMTTWKDNLIKAINVLHNWIWQIDTKISELDSQSVESTDFDLDEFKIAMKTITRIKAAFHTIQMTTDNVDYWKSRMLQCETTLKHREAQLETIISELSELQKQKDISEAVAELGELEKLIITYSDEIDSLKTQNVADASVSKSDLDSLYEFETNVYPLLDSLAQAPVRKLWTPDLISKIEQRQWSYVNELNKLVPQLTELAADFEKLSFESKQIPMAPTDCHREDCGLLHTAKTREQEVRDKQVSLGKTIERLTERKNALEKKTKILGDKLSAQYPYRDLISRIDQLIRDYPVVRQLFKISCYRDLNIKDPLFLLTLCKQKYAEGERRLKINQLTEEIMKLKVKRDSLKSSSSKSVKFVDEMIQRKKKEQKVAIAEFNAVENDKKHMAWVVTQIEEKNNALGSLASWEERLDTHQNTIKINRELEFFKQLRNRCVEAQDEIQEELLDLQAKVKEQTSLKDKRAELDELIQRAKQDLREYEIIEKCLSPAFGIPQKYMARYMNAIIDGANGIIARVFSYHFKIRPVDENTPLTFDLSAEVGDVIVDDVSNCSTGQQDMINLAWTLSMMIQLRLVNYPIYLDEFGNTFDEHHRQRLLNLITELQNLRVITQVFMINHHAIVHEGILDRDVLVLADSNIMVPEVYNEHVEIAK